MEQTSTTPTEVTAIPALQKESSPSLEEVSQGTLREVSVAEYAYTRATRTNAHLNSPVEKSMTTLLRMEVAYISTDGQSTQ